jgi:hypothetical protein
MANTQSGTYDYFYAQRDQITTRALRIVGAIGTGETPASSQLTEGAEALNDLCKEYQAYGMPLWKITALTPWAYTATNTYTIGLGSTIAQVAPLKILFARNKNSISTPALYTPMILVPKMDYYLLGIPDATGRPNQLNYTPPGAPFKGTNLDAEGTIRVYPSPDAYTIANVTCEMVCHLPYQDFAISTDIPDFPQHWLNAIKWGLAAELSYEYGVNVQERGMLEKRADMHVQQALSFGTEEGSLWIQPAPQWTAERFM